MKRKFIILLIGVLLCSSLSFAYTEVSIYSDDTLITVTTDAEDVYSDADGVIMNLDLPVSYLLAGVALLDQEVLDHPELRAYVMRDDGVTRDLYSELNIYVGGSYTIDLSSVEPVTFEIIIENGAESLTKFIYFESTEMSLLENRYAYYRAGSTHFQGDYLIDNLNTEEISEVTIEVYNSELEMILDSNQTEYLEVYETLEGFKVLFSRPLLEGVELEDGETYTAHITGPNGTVTAETVATSQPIIEGVDLIAMDENQRQYWILGDNLDALLELPLEVVDASTALIEPTEISQFSAYEHNPIVMTIPNDTTEDYWLISDDIIIQRVDANRLYYNASGTSLGLVKVDPKTDVVEISVTGLNLTLEAMSQIELTDGTTAIDLLDYTPVIYTDGLLKGFKFTVPFADLTADMGQLSIYFVEGHIHGMSIHLPIGIFEPGEITITNMTENMMVINTITPVVLTSEVMTLTYLLDGQTYVYETPIAEAGPHTLVVQGINAYGQETTETIHFTVLKTPTIQMDPLKALPGETVVLKAYVTQINPLKDVVVKFLIDDVIVGQAITNDLGYAKVSVLLNQSIGAHNLKVVTSEDLSRYLTEATFTTNLVISELKAFEVQNRFVTGGGKTHMGQYSFNVRHQNQIAKGHFNFQDKRTKMKFKSTQIDQLIMSDNQAIISGSGYYHKSKKRIQFEVKINTTHNTMVVVISDGNNVLFNSGVQNITHGKIKIK